MPGSLHDIVLANVTMTLLISPQRNHIVFRCLECCCCVWSVLLLSWTIRLWGGTPLAWLAACVVSWDTRVMIVVRGHSYMYIAAAAARSEK